MAKVGIGLGSGEFYPSFFPIGRFQTFTISLKKNLNKKKGDENKDQNDQGNNYWSNWVREFFVVVKSDQIKEEEKEKEEKNIKKMST